MSLSSDFPPNSRSARAKKPEEPKNIERVTSVEAKRRKKGLGRQFKETFVAGDIRGATQYVVLNVLIPSAKDMLAEAIQSGFERLIYGESARPRRGMPPGYGARVAYNRMGSGPLTQTTQPSPQRGGRMLSRSSRTRHDFDEIVIPSRQEAEDVLDRMYEMLSKFGMVPVADLYEMTGIQSSHTDFKWGWTDLRGSRVARLRSGDFLLDLPEPAPF